MKTKLKLNTQKYLAFICWIALPTTLPRYVKIWYYLHCLVTDRDDTFGTMPSVYATPFYTEEIIVSTQKRTTQSSPIIQI